MSNVEILTKEKHQNLKLKKNKDAYLGIGNSVCVTFPIEFRNIQSHYPIFFQKNPDGEDFSSVALLGLEPKENLFVTQDGWDCGYVPLALDVQPFVIGRDSKNENDGRVFIDLDSPLIAGDDEENGIAIFDEMGAESEYLKNTVKNMEILHFGFESAKGYVDWLVKYDLLEPFVLDVSLQDQSLNRLTGFQTINEERFKELEDELLLEMRSKGYLMPTFMILASMASVTGLIERKNRQL